MNWLFLKIHKNLKFVSLGLLGFFMIGIGLLMNSYALNEPVPKISFFSKTLSYEKKNSGSWKIEKSAEWIGLGKARITFQVDTVLRTGNPNTDVILVLDISGSMAGEKLDRVKEDSISLLNTLLSNPNNQAALITFDTGSELVSGFTNDKSSLTEKISSLSDQGSTNYYQPLVHVDEILKNYSKEKDTECVVLFLTDGYPNEDIPNQIGEYKYLKSEYPWLNIHGVQYEMGEEILDPIKEISDSQFIADMTTLNNILFDASVVPTPYENFILTDWINNEYFDLKNVSNIQSSIGKVKLEDDNGVSKVTWDLSGLGAGRSATLTIDIDLKEAYLEEGGLYLTNKSSEVVSQIEEDREDVTTKETPILASHYNVTYDGNAPSGCSVSGVPEKSSYRVFETVEKSSETPTCQGYQFKGWKIVTGGVKKLNDDYFTMPEKDVTLRAEWGRMGLSKSVEGEVYVQKDPVLQEIDSSSYNGELWQYKESITKIVIEGEQTLKEGATDELTWDISEAKDGSVRGLLVPNSDDSSTYTAYIQGLEGRVIANSDSSYLFGGDYFSSFSKLKAIEDLELLDTSQVSDMSEMFSRCRALTGLDLSSWDTRKVTNMYEMFYNCYSLTTLDLNGWDTSQVANMDCMFYNCSTLTSLEGLSDWNTSQLKNMMQMFYYCSSLISLDLSGWDTGHVGNMSMVFYNCYVLTSLEGLSDWDTSQVTNMSGMFDNCKVLTSLDLSGWSTGRVTNMSQVFSGCKALTSLDLSGWDTSQVTDMASMFNGCSQLTSLEGLKNWDTSHVTDMSYMFKDCIRLTSLEDLSNWHTNQVTSMRSMFSSCQDLINMGDISDWDTSQVTNMSQMFHNCLSLTSLNLGKWNTGQVTNMCNMFEGCYDLTSVGDISGWDTSKVTDMHYMFYWCQRLISLDLSSWNTSQVTDMHYIFSNCYSLTSIGNLNGWDTSKVTDMNEMFFNCHALTNVGNLSGWNVEQVTNMSRMFYGCKSLTSLDISGWDTSKVTDMSSMFSGCSTLTTTISILNNSVTSYDYMFSSAATQNNAQITVNYTTESEALVDQMIATRSEKSNVVKASGPCVEHSVTIQDREDIIATPSGGIITTKITLTSTQDNCVVTSFDMNGTKMKGNTFVMPNEDVIITNVTVVEGTIMESKHNPYDSDLNEEYEHTFDNATSLTVILEYQTEGPSWDYIYLYDSNEKQYGKYGGSTKTTETILIPGNYLKILFHTDSSGSDYYGFKATIIPNYDE